MQDHHQPGVRRQWGVAFVPGPRCANLGPATGVRYMDPRPTNAPTGWRRASFWRRNDTNARPCSVSWNFAEEVPGPRLERALDRGDHVVVLRIRLARAEGADRLPPSLPDQDLCGNSRAGNGRASPSLGPGRPIL